MSDPTAATPTPASTPARPRHKRRLSNYLLDKKLQLRYVIIVTLLSGLITGTLGYLIFDQQSQSTTSIKDDLHELVTDEADIENIARPFEQQDRVLVYKMFGAGVGLVVILSLFLVVMTHKVAGPLFKTSIYFDRMAEGRLGHVTPLRQGDMLQDFFAKFKDMHDAVRIRALEDIAVMERALESLKQSGNQADYRGEAHTKLAAELALLEAHIAKLKKETDTTRSEKRTGAPGDAIEQIRRAARDAFLAGAFGAGAFVVVGGVTLFFFFWAGPLLLVGVVFGIGAMFRAHVVQTRANEYGVGHEYLHTASTASMLGTVTVAFSVVAIGMYVMARI